MHNANAQEQPDGVLLLDKPAGITSHDCVAKIRRLYATKKVGHTGTLDPMATGVLPILIGRAAKAAEYLTAEDKRYIARLRLGITTDTEDTMGNVLTHSDDIPADDAVFAAIASFVGQIEQIPPMYSALKINGQKLCDLARQGITVERQPRPVTITSINAEKEDRNTYLLDVSCSKGTYIRTLCADIGARLGCGGAMASLRRIASGHFSIEQAHTLEEIETLSDKERLALLAPTESLFSDLCAVTLPPFYERLCANGQKIYLSRLFRGKPEEANRFSAGSGMRVRIYGAQRGFFALGEITEEPDPEGKAIRMIKRFSLD